MSRESVDYLHRYPVAGTVTRPKCGHSPVATGCRWHTCYAPGAPVPFANVGTRYPVPAFVRDHGDQGAPSDLRAITRAALADLATRPLGAPTGLILQDHHGHRWAAPYVRTGTRMVLVNTPPYAVAEPVYAPVPSGLCLDCCAPWSDSGGCPGPGAAVDQGADQGATEQPGPGA